MDVHGKPGSDPTSNLDKLFNPNSTKHKWTPEQQKAYKVAGAIIGMATLGIGHGIYHLAKKISEYDPDKTKVSTTIKDGKIERDMVTQIQTDHATVLKSEDELREFILGEIVRAKEVNLNPQELSSQIKGLMNNRSIVFNKVIRDNSRSKVAEDFNARERQQETIFLSVCNEMVKNKEFLTNCNVEDKVHLNNFAELCLSDPRHSEEVITMATELKEKLGVV